ncbi:MAG: hypothetical protein ACKOA4_01685 [Haliscomenobacter sp.]
MLWKRTPSGVYLLLSLLCFCGCGRDNAQGSDRLLARVYGKELRVSDMEGMFPANTSSVDSGLIINAYVQRWVREALLLNEAEKNLPRDLNVDKLVEDYRASLIKNNYEEVLVEQLLDTTVTEAELQQFYERNKAQYQLEKPIIRCYFIKVASDAPDIARLMSWWTSPSAANMECINAYCDEHAESHILNEEGWHRLEDILSALPAGSLDEANLGAVKEFRQNDGKFQYFFRLLEVKQSQEIAPLSFIREQARKYILHLRKLKILEEKRNDLYEVGMRRRGVQIFNE